MIDTDQQAGNVARAVADREVQGRPAKVVVLAQTYPTDQTDLWDAVTNAERLPRWFAPVTGELREGGRYQVQGNAGGTVTRCDAPKAFDATWEWEGSVSWIEVRPEARPTTGLLMKGWLRMSRAMWTRKCSRSARSIGLKGSLPATSIPLASMMLR